MSKWFYFSKETRFRLIFIFLIISFFAPWWFGLILLLIYPVGLWFYRRKQIDFTARRVIESNIILCPLTGTLRNIETLEECIRLSIKSNSFDDFGIFMPFYGDVSSYFSPDESRKFHEILVKSEDIEFVKININEGIIEPKIYADAGDKASGGALLGYNPFGGTSIVEIPRSAQLAVKKGDKLLSSQTILASI